jgi:hypothetical protein
VAPALIVEGAAGEPPVDLDRPDPAVEADHQERGPC